MPESRAPASEITASAFDRVMGTCRRPLHSYRIIDLERARALHSDNLQQELAGAATPFLSGDGTTFILAARKLEWDTKHFGFGIGRAELVLADTVEGNKDILLRAFDECIDWARESNLNSISLQLDAAGHTELCASRHSGFFLADTIISYIKNLSQLDVQPASSFIRAATANDGDALYKISADCFGDPRLNLNRFNADPLFCNEQVRDMYGLWAGNSVRGNLADRVFLYESNGEVLGFITVKLPRKQDKQQGVDLATIPLNAVRADCHGRGIYQQLVSSALLWLKAQGIGWVEIRTQVSNLAVHRTWQKLNARMSLTYYTMHKTLDSI